MMSLNKRLILEPYITDRALKAKETNGFALIQQKVSVIGLRVLMDCQSMEVPYFKIEKGAKAYIREELLHTQAWAQKILESDAVEGKFIIVDISNVEFVVPA